ncbi:hypothetical protein A9762_15155 [Pandoraea sp. ISTKB]|nr:hypothetical protein A9762_15155 [Pandoraea sp. ISTKB]
MHLLLEQRPRTLPVIAHVALASPAKAHAQRKAKVLLRLRECRFLVLCDGGFDQGDMAGNLGE